MSEQYEGLCMEAHTLLDLCWNGIRTAIADDDGLDGAIGETLMKEIRELQARLPSPNG